MLRNTVLVIALLVICGGCRELLRDPAPPADAPEGPSTKEEVLAEIRPMITPIRNTAMGVGTGVSEAERYVIMANLRDAVMRYGDKDFGREALRELGYELQELAKRASAIERYRLVLICIDAAEMLEVDSQLLKRLGTKADVMLDKPTIRVKGFIDDIEKNQTYIFIEMINHRSGTVERMEAREGDEFNDLRLVRILGRNKAVLFEYLKVPGLFFEVESF